MDIAEFDRLFQDNCPRFDDNYVTSRSSNDFNDNLFIREARKMCKLSENNNENREKNPSDKDLNNNSVRNKTHQNGNHHVKPPSHMTKTIKRCVCWFKSE